MENENNRNITNYEPYFNGIHAIHKDIHNELLTMWFVKKETEMFILQCSYQEYVSYGHDTNYEWFRFCFEDDENKDFALGVNKLRFANNEKDVAKLVKKIEEVWLKHCNTNVRYIGKIKEIKSLDKNPYEMIISIHFCFDKTLIDDGITDTQFIKIVYTGKSINDNVDKIKKLY